MDKIILAVIICAVIWIANGIWILQAIRQRIPSEVYMHLGLGLYFTMLAIELLLGDVMGWKRWEIDWLQWVGFILYIPAAALVVGAILELHRKGKSESADLFDTAAFVDTGVYGIVRQPMTLGAAIWSFALILVFRSFFSLLVGIACVFLFWMSARTEDAYNIRKFGDKYREYTKRVPIWNVVKCFSKHR